MRVKGPSLPYDPTYHLLWRVDKIHAVVKAEHPDVLEIHSPYVAAASALTQSRRTFGVRTFQWHADFIDTYLREMLKTRLRSSELSDSILQPLWAMVKRIASGCDATFVASQWQMEKLESHGVPRLIHQPFGVEGNVFNPANASTRVREQWLGGRPNETTLLVGVGRFAVEKHWHVVLDAFIELRKKRDAVLVLFGDGPERKKMEARVAGRNDVHLPGFEKDRQRLGAALASADALVHSCPFETFGLSIAEALQAGLPVVVPDQGGAFEFADPSCAEVYSALNANGCARAIERILKRDRRELRENAVRFASALPTENDYFKKRIDLYEELIDRKRHT